MHVTDMYEASKLDLTFACDVYSLGSVILQVCLVKALCSHCGADFTLWQTLSSQQPYYNVKDTRVALLILLIKKPERPASQPLTNEYWNFIQRCWDEPYLRPSAAKAHEALLYLGNAALHPNRV